jgi:hypothetical protein
VTPRLGIWCSILLSYGTIEGGINGSGGFANTFGDPPARAFAIRKRYRASAVSVSLTQ